MENANQKFKGVKIASAILFIYFALDGVDYITDVFRYQYEPTLFLLVAVIISIVTNLLIAISLFRHKNYKLLKVGLLILAITKCYIALEAILIYDSHFLYILVDLLNVASAIMIFVIVNMLSRDNEKDNADVIKKIWYIPALCAGVAFILYAIACLAVAFSFQAYIITVMADVAKYLLLGLYLAYPNGFEKEENQSIDGECTEESEINAIRSSEPKGYYSMAKHIILLIFTFGIWWLIWIYKTTDFLNCVRGEKQRGAVAQLLLCLFVPFYIIYWTYESAKRIDKLAKTKGVESDITTMCILFAIFIGILAPIFMQDKINNIVTAKTETTSTEASITEEVDATPAPEIIKPVKAKTSDAKGVAEDLKTYKDLLDNGIITQEEFDVKKKEILGL